MYSENGDVGEDEAPILSSISGFSSNSGALYSGGGVVNLPYIVPQVRKPYDTFWREGARPGLEVSCMQNLFSTKVDDKVNI